MVNDQEEARPDSRSERAARPRRQPVLPLERRRVAEVVRV